MRFLGEFVTTNPSAGGDGAMRGARDRKRRGMRAIAKATTLVAVMSAENARLPVIEPLKQEAESGSKLTEERTPANRAARFKAALEEVLTDHAETLRKLAQ